MNTFKKTGGFTLVELIIVIAILAILSSVAVAGYSSYIKKANDSAVETFLNNISTSAVLANAQTGGIQSIVVSEEATGTNAGKLKVVITGVNGLDAKYFETDFEKSVTGWTTDSKITDGVYTGYIAAPNAWTGSNYDGTTTTWNGTWPEN